MAVVCVYSFKLLYLLKVHLLQCSSVTFLDCVKSTLEVVPKFLTSVLYNIHITHFSLKFSGRSEKKQILTPLTPLLFHWQIV